jgi:hypothetical protein
LVVVVVEVTEVLRDALAHLLRKRELFVISSVDVHLRGELVVEDAVEVVHLDILVVRLEPGLHGGLVFDEFEN